MGLGDILGSVGEDLNKPEGTSLWQMDRFLEELQVVFMQLGLERQYTYSSSTGIILFLLNICCATPAPLGLYSQ